jgi:hypothetical protein
VRLKMPAPTSAVPFMLAALVALGMTACGGPSAPAPEAAAPPKEASAPATDTQAADAATAEQAAADQAAADQAAAELAAREQELKAKEVELELRERELASQQAAAAKQATKAPAPAKAASTPKPAESAAAPAPAAPPPPPPPPVTVAAGSQLSIKLNSDYSTKTTALGAPVNAQLAADFVVDGRTVARAGAPISGTVTEVTSGSKKIGAVPALKIDFTQMVVADGSTMPVAIRINQKGQSEKGRDTAKVAGGTAAGAIIGHQIDSGKGAVIGGIVGGAAGAIGAAKTGTEVEIPAGTVLTANVRSAFTYDGR